MWNDLIINVNGESVLLDALGAAFLPAHRALVVADMHFEKGSSFARTGQFLPPYDSRATLLKLAEAVGRHQPAVVVALGDSFHDGEAGGRIGAEERAMLDALARVAEWVWIAGNHDPKPPAWLGGRTAGEITFGGLTLRHEPHAELHLGEVAGHLHPCATAAKWGRSVRRRCFVSDGLRLVLPAFGAYAGGLDVRETPIAGLFAGPYHAYMLGRTRVYAMAHRKSA
ncbi:MAG: ligase-associated DNA damage response endonuclease PdeM [Alphaproteobacteria bacterium]|nr:ligase-associated DNA damage response endonuclease PdeM [Alphaproteobacteria bacterium]